MKYVFLCTDTRTYIQFAVNTLEEASAWMGDDPCRVYQYVKVMWVNDQGKEIPVES